MLGDDSLTRFLPRLSLETRKSSLSQKTNDHTLSAATPPGGCPSHPGKWLHYTCLAFGERTGGYLGGNPCRGR